MARCAAAGAVQEHPAADSETPQLRPHPGGILEPNRPGPRPLEPLCKRTWQQNEKAGIGSWPPLPPPPPPRCSWRSAPCALRAACLAGLLVASGLFHSGPRAGEKEDPQLSRSGHWQRVEKLVRATSRRRKRRGRELVPGCGGAGAGMSRPWSGLHGAHGAGPRCDRGAA